MLKHHAERKVLILYGSSSKDGMTKKTVNALAEDTDAEIIDVGSNNITPYDYEGLNKDDYFMFVSKKMLQYDTIVFATPVYWYAMSAQMKIFFDRFSDLITIRKPDGRALAGKRTYLIANGTDIDLPQGFEIPFQRTSDYFDMEYMGAYYLYAGKNPEHVQQTLNGFPAFKKKIFSGTHHKKEEERHA